MMRSALPGRALLCLSLLLPLPVFAADTCNVKAVLGGKAVTLTHCAASVYEDAHSVTLIFSEAPLGEKELDAFRISSYAGEKDEAGRPRTLVHFAFCPGGGKPEASPAAPKSVEIGIDRADSPLAGRQWVFELPKEKETFSFRKLAGTTPGGGSPAATGARRATALCTPGMRRSILALPAERRPASAAGTERAFSAPAKNPGRHAALPLHDGRLQRVDERAAESVREGNERFLVDEVALAAVREPEPPVADRRKTALHPDRGREAAEEDSAARNDAPRAVQHRPEVGAVPREVQDGARDHEVAGAIRKAVRLDGLGAEIRRGRPGRERLGQRANRLDRARIGVHRGHVVALAQEVDEVAAGAAARVEDPRPRRDPPAEDLVEEVDVDRPDERREIRHRNVTAPIVQFRP